MSTAVQPIPGVLNPRGRHSSIPANMSTYQGPQKLTLAKFVNEFNKEFPVKFVVTKGFYGPREDLKFSDGDQFTAHSLKMSTVVNIEHENGQRKSVPVDYPIPFAILYNPNDNIAEAIKGYKYEKVSELVQLPILPPLIWSRKAYQGSSPESSVAANELLIVRSVKSRLVGRQQLKVYSLTQRKEKTLYTTCTGSFTTKPRDISLYMPDILKHMPDIFPCRAVMFNAEGGQHLPGSAMSNSVRSGPSVVTLLHTSANNSVVVSSALGLRFPSSGNAFLEVPVDLSIMVQKDNFVTPVGSPANNGIYEDLYDKVKGERNLPQQLNANSTAHRHQQNSQLYTNVLFSQQNVQRRNSTQYPSAESAIESGHYQMPSVVFKERTSSDPIAIDSVYHPPDDALPGNYVMLEKKRSCGSNGSNGSSGSYGSNPSRGGLPGSLERNSPSGRNGTNGGEVVSVSPSYRPPLPPPNRIRRTQQRSPGYTYVETNPIRATKVFEAQAHRTHAKNSSDSGIVLESSHPESATSMSSFGSSGSGGAVVDRRSSFNRTASHPGSGDGIVERSMRSSSISSQGYSYAKTNAPLSHNSAPRHLPPAATANPTSPHHYSHLRSRSGPPIAPQLQPLSAQIEQYQSGGQFSANSQPPVATTRLDEDSGSIVVVQRQASAPIMATPNQGQRSVVSEEVRRKEIERPDDLALVLDDLAKITQELDENIFPQDSNSTPSPSNAAPPISQPRDVQTTPSGPSQQPADKADIPPEVVEKNKSYLKSLDNYQIITLLEMMGLEQYTPTFKQEQINGDILYTCDDALLKDELKVTSRLHRIRLLKVITGTYSIHEIMAGKDGYIFMASAGKQH